MNMLFCSEEQLVKPLLADFLKIVLLERTPFAKKAFIGCAFHFSLVLECRQLQRAKVVCDLEQAIFARTCISINHSIFGKNIFDGVVEGFGDDGLPIVVIDFYFIKSLKAFDIVEKRVYKIALHSLEKALSAAEHVLSVRERQIRKWYVVRKNPKAGQVFLPFIYRESLVVFVSSQEQASVHGYVLEPFVVKVCDVWLNAALDVKRLIVKYENDEVEAGLLADVARFIYKNRELFGHGGLLKTKNAGGNPPALGGRPLREDQLFYTTNQGVISSRKYTRTHVLKHLIDRLVYGINFSASKT